MDEGSNNDLFIQFFRLVAPLFLALTPVTWTLVTWKLVTWTPVTWTRPTSMFHGNKSNIDTAQVHERTRTNMYAHVRTMILFHLSGSSMQLIMYVAKSDLRNINKKEEVLLMSKHNAKFFDFLDENRLIFVVLSGRFQNLF